MCRTSGGWRSSLRRSGTGCFCADRRGRWRRGSRCWDSGRRRCRRERLTPARRESRTAFKWAGVRASGRPVQKAKNERETGHAPPFLAQVMFAQAHADVVDEEGAVADEEGGVATLEHGGQVWLHGHEFRLDVEPLGAEDAHEGGGGPGAGVEGDGPGSCQRLAGRRRRPRRPVQSR